MNGSWIWKTIAAGLCGNAAHYALMYFKARSGILPSFQPYHTLQVVMGEWLGRDVSPLVPWALSFFNGMAVLGFVFGRLYRRIPGSGGLTKGVVFGIAGWLAMTLLFFPAIGLGPFAMQAGLGIQPALFAMAMMLTYSIVMGFVYSRLNT